MSSIASMKSATALASACSPRNLDRAGPSTLVLRKNFDRSQLLWRLTALPTNERGDHYGKIPRTMSTKAAITRLDQLLKPTGFSQTKVTWKREIGSVFDVIDVQVSKATHRLTINAGVLDAN